MKIYIATGTCSRAAQVIANEIGLDHELVHFDVVGKSTSNGDKFAEINPLLYVPALAFEDEANDILTETTIIISYLADQNPAADLIPVRGTMERAKLDQLQATATTEIAQKHIPLMRKLMTPEGIDFNINKLLKAYQTLEDRLADGRPYLLGNKFSVADAYAWATLWGHRSGVDISHLKNFAAWRERVEARPSTVKALQNEAEIVAIHRAQIAARAA